MSDVKQILVVDDHFEMLEFLRSMLELSNTEYQVLGVPSGEEGLLELKRTPFDLLITDVRLPGMSGFDLARKVKAIRSETPIIIITGYSSEQGRLEADDLGVVSYFKKPLDTDALLAAVHASLHGGSVAPKPLSSLPKWRISYEARRRLETLRADTGARQVALIDSGGSVLFSSGRTVELSSLAGTIAESMAGSFRLAEGLGSAEPFTIQYQAGQQYDLYSANAGRDHIVAIFFDAQSRRGRIGTIWVFAQRAIHDLVGLLDSTAPRKTKTGEAGALDDPADVRQQPATVSEKPAKEAVEPQPANQAPAEAAEKPASEAPPAEPLTLAEMQTLLGVELPEEAGEIDLDSFWEDALAQESGDEERNRSGLSIDEARRQGLIPTDFDDNKDGH
jgi:DNA-binding response OmpR family regulator